VQVEVMQAKSLIAADPTKIQVWVSANEMHAIP
jgi:hypothetical protein